LNKLTFVLIGLFIIVSVVAGIIAFVSSDQALVQAIQPTLIMIAWSLLALVLIMGLWIGFQTRESKRELPLITELWEATRQITEKHKDILINVAELPEPSDNEKIMRINSLAELVKVADSLLKPVLHQTDGENHIYIDIDGTVWYMYLTIEPMS